LCFWLKLIHLSYVINQIIGKKKGKFEEFSRKINPNLGTGDWGLGKREKKITRRCLRHDFTRYLSRKGAKAQKTPRGRGKREEEGVIVSTISVKFHAMLSDKNPFFFLCVLCVFASFA
jgi:hypothetical protein